MGILTLEEVESDLNKWFELVRKPITREGIDDEIETDKKTRINSGPISNKQKTPREYVARVKRPAKSSSIPNRKRHNLNSLDEYTKQLEMLLESDTDDIKQPQQYFYHQVYESDKEALLDCSLGHACSIITTRPIHTKSSFVVIDTCNDTLIENISKDLECTIKTPLDHDYLPSRRDIKLKHALTDSVDRYSHLESKPILFPQAINIFRQMQRIQS